MSLTSTIKRKLYPYHTLRTTCATILLCLTWAPLMAAVVDISTILTPGPQGTSQGILIDATVGAGNTGLLVGSTETYWGSGGFSVPLNLNGNTLIIDSGGGNAMNASGPISGNGVVQVNAGGIGVLYITGSVGNTYTGTTVLNSGPVSLGKSSGNALCGTITVQGTPSADFPGMGNVIWTASNQIADTSDVSLVTSGAWLNLAGFSDTINSLTLASGTYVATGSGGVLTASTLTNAGVALPTGVYTAANASWVTGSGQVVIGSANQAPGAPLNLQASDGTYTNIITVRWDAAAFANSYQLYRNTVSNSATASAIGGVLTTNAYTDGSAVYGQTYFYWVTASNTHGASAFSVGDSGYLANIPAPSGLAASDGTYADRVALSWSAVSGATSYQVYRSASSSPGTALLLATNIATLSYNDSNVVQEQVYYYWVSALSGANASGLSVSDSGYSEMAGGPFYNIAGEVTNPNATIPPGYTARCTTNADFGWQTGTCSINVYNGGYWFGIDNGNGNALNYGGMIFGTGGVYYAASPQGTYFEVPIQLSGSASNTYSGITWIQKGHVLAAKNNGVRSIPGDVLLGGTDKAILKFGATGQIGTSARITTTNAIPCGIEPNGYDVTVGIWDMQGPSLIDFRSSNATVHIADCHTTAWNLASEFQIFNWKSSAQTPVFFGNSASGLTTAQLAQVGFQSPAGFVAGLYRSAISASGEVTPAAKVEAINPPFDVSTNAQAARQLIYTSNGRANLSGAGTPLTSGMKIDFFGDSITWLNGYVSYIQTALNSGAGTSSRNITCINRGINGGGVLAVRDGSPDSAYPGSVAQAPFASVIASDQASVAVVYIGINDVWWRGTSTNTFDQALRDIAASASSAGVKLVLATLSVHYEKPDGSNPDDPAIEVFAQITRQVAADTHASLVDLRRVYIAYEQNNNWQLNLDGSLTYQTTGILTYDGVHPLDVGANLLADQISQGIYNAFVTQPAAPAGLTASATNLLVSLKWNPVSNATGYNVKRSLASNGFYAVVGGTSGSATNYADAVVTNGVLYWYAVSATNSAGESANSAVVSARPLPAAAPIPVLLTGGGASSGFSLNPATGATLRFAGMGGINYCVSYRDDLRPGSWTNLDWQLCTNNGTAPMALMDPGATNTPQRFYRIGSQKP